MCLLECSEDGNLVGLDHFGTAAEQALTFAANKLNINLFNVAADCVKIVSKHLKQVLLDDPAALTDTQRQQLDKLACAALPGGVSEAKGPYKGLAQMSFDALCAMLVQVSNEASRPETRQTAMDLLAALLEVLQETYTVWAGHSPSAPVPQLIQEMREAHQYRKNRNEASSAHPLESIDAATRADAVALLREGLQVDHCIFWPIKTVANLALLMCEQDSAAQPQADAIQLQDFNF